MASVFFNGFAADGKDYTKQVFRGLADLSVSGTQGVANVQAGDVYINYSGTASVYVAVPANFSKSNSAFSVSDSFGGAAGANIVISGVPNAAGQTDLFNGAATYTISSAYGRANVTLWSGISSTNQALWIVK